MEFVLKLGLTLIAVTFAFMVFIREDLRRNYETILIYTHNLCEKWYHWVVFVVTWIIIGVFASGVALTLMGVVYHIVKWIWK